ncbi:MAG: histidine kinase dimerization/phosphoacceptor domain -containing protein [Synechococcales bacterium]|nr:histidine kinase dimerization/phosphoacceptor domain -containing protein [Synechococcales bacterium]
MTQLRHRGSYQLVSFYRIFNGAIAQSLPLDIQNTLFSTLQLQGRDCVGTLNTMTNSPHLDSYIIALRDSLHPLATLTEPDRQQVFAALGDLSDYLPQASRTLALEQINLQLQQEILQRQQTEQSLRESQVCLRLLNSISRQKMAGRSFEAVVAVTVEQMSRYFGDRPLYYLTLEGKQIQATHTVYPDLLSPDRPFALNLEPAIDLWTFLQRRQTLIVEQVDQEPLLTPVAAALHSQAVEAILAVPLQVGTGILCCTRSQPHTWTAYEVATFAEIADYLTIVFQEAQAQQERQYAEAQLLASLHEKEVMLKEIHHRVKNNLQVISSLLKLQAGHIKQEGVLEAFQDSQHRVRAMALIHEKLYQSADLAKANFADYVKSLVAELLRCFSLGTRNIQLDLNLAPVCLSLDTALPCGLIINELVSNALKYAFAENPYPRLSLDFYSDGEDSYRLIIQDNGRGLPSNYSFQTTPTLGLQLVKSLIQQLRGTMSYDYRDGAVFTVTFIDAKGKG